jgi:predicted RNA-binding protein
MFGGECLYRDILILEAHGILAESVPYRDILILEVHDYREIAGRVTQGAVTERVTRSCVSGLS